MDKLIALIKNAAVQRAFYALLLALLTFFGQGCKDIRPEVAQFECQLTALETVVPLAAAEDLVMAARNGSTDYLIKSLLSFGAKTDEIQTAADQFNACSKPKVETPDAGPVPVTLLGV